MKKRIYLIICLSLFVFLLSACTKLNSGDTFTAEEQGIEYQFEVIVSKMNYVRVRPMADPGSLSGAIVIPSVGKYEGTQYVVSQIAKEAFKNYVHITSVMLPPTISVIEEAAFQGCVALTSINTPQPLSTIEKEAFDGCRALKYFDLEASLSSLGTACFRNCTMLSGISFPSSFSEIPDEAFYACSSLTDLTLPATIMRVGNEAFANCGALRHIYMDRSVQNIGEEAFSACTSVESITCLTATPPTCFSSTFEGIPSGIPVTVPMPHVNDYQAATGWNHFTNFQGTY